MQHADGRTPLSAERRTPSPEREAAISLAAGARARSTHAIGAERVARGDASSLGQHPQLSLQCALAAPPPPAHLHTTGRLLPTSATLTTFAKRGRGVTERIWHSRFAAACWR